MNTVFSLFFVLVVILMFSIPFIVMGGIVYMIVKGVKGKEQRTQSFRAYAAQNSLQFIGETSPSNLRGAQIFYLFSLGSTKQIKNLITGAIGGIHVSIFDYWYLKGSAGSKGIQIGGLGIGGSRGNGHWHAQTVIMLESPRLNLPLFSMRPESQGFLNKLGDVFGYQDIDFASHPTFSKKYLLRGTAAAHIMHVFNSSVLSSLEKTQGLSIEGGGTRLFVYRQNAQIDPARLGALFEEAMGIAGLFSVQSVSN